MSQRHPIKTLKALIEMGAKECCLTPVEDSLLIEQFEELFFDATTSYGRLLSDQILEEYGVNYHQHKAGGSRAEKIMD